MVIPCGHTTELGLYLAILSIRWSLRTLGCVPFSFPLRSPIKVRLQGSAASGALAETESSAFWPLNLASCKDDFVTEFGEIMI